jgi:hypothetical protein
MFIARPSMKDVQATGKAPVRENIQHFKIVHSYTIVKVCV